MNSNKIKQQPVPEVIYNTENYFVINSQQAYFISGKEDRYLKILYQTSRQTALKIATTCTLA